MRKVDIAIIGGGLAGTTLTWRLLDAGIDVALIDNEHTSTASRIAAGLLTPITGQRFAAAWEWDNFWNFARNFYRDIERRTQTEFFREVPMLRLFRSEAERNHFRERLPRLAPLITSTSPRFDPELLKTQCGGFEMLGGRLDVTAYLNASRSQFRNINSYVNCEVDPARDLRDKGRLIAISAADVIAKKVILCLGYSNFNSACFDNVRFNPCKGEILTAQSSANLTSIIHHGIWMAPEDETRFKVGATYDWEDFTTAPTPRAEKSILELLHEFFLPECRIVGHQAAIRPTMHDFRPVIGMHPQRSHIGMFNGLGSKGSLMAPRLAQLFVESLVNHAPIPQEVSLARWFA